MTVGEACNSNESSRQNAEVWITKTDSTAALLPAYMSIVNMDIENTPNGRKRSLDEDAVATTPATLKKRRVDHCVAASSPIPKALNAINSAAPETFGNNLSAAAQQPLSQTQPPPAAASPAFRPAIKLKALRGTIWDAGEESPRPTALPKKVGPGRPRKNIPPKQPSAPKPRGRKPKNRKAIEDAKNGNPLETTSAEGQQPHNERESTDELSAVGLSQEPLSVPNPTPKSILTPTKRGRPPGRKNVTFGSKQNANGEVFFDDLPKKTRTPKKAANPAADEIVCAICIKPDSQAPNQIILCDMCDFAVHQECYGVPDIPEGDWLCKSCAQEDVLKTPRRAKETEAIPRIVVTEVPDIPNLDHHVRSLQRVLLDRCTGRRRLRMAGQLEAEEKVQQLVEQTVVAGEGNSMLLIGARGCGKSAVILSLLWVLWANANA